MVKYKDLSDEALFEGLELDDQHAFTELYSRYSGLLLVYGSNLMQDEEESADLVQQLFMKIWENRKTITVHNAVKPFLYRSLLNMVLNRMKRLKIAERYFATAQQSWEQGTLSADAALLEKELQQQIEAGVAKLPKKMREVFEYSRKEELSYKEIGEKLGISHATVASHIQNALRILRKSINTLLFMVI